MLLYIVFILIQPPSIVAEYSNSVTCSTNFNLRVQYAFMTSNASTLSSRLGKKCIA